MTKFESAVDAILAIAIEKGQHSLNDTKRVAKAYKVNGIKLWNKTVPMFDALKKD